MMRRSGIVVGLSALAVAVLTAGCQTASEAAKTSDVLDDTFYEKCGGPRIDYIYVTPGTRVLDYRTVNDVRSDQKMYPSDHFPVVATIVLP